MSFANQYIQKYGEKAVEAYKRSLKHSDLQLEDSPRMQPHQKTIKRSSSQLKNRSNHSKSCKSIKPNPKLKHVSSRSLLQNPNAKPPSKNSSGFGHTFNSVHLNLQHLVNPQKKKLIISQINTPKHQTPNKVVLIGHKHKDSKAGINTNVNVYVQAIHKSKSKSKQTTPSRYLQLQQSRQRQPSNKHKKHPGQIQIIRQTIHFVEQERQKRDSKGLKQVKEKLMQLQNIAHRKEKKMLKLQTKFDKMRDLMKKEWEVEEGSISADRERELKDRVKELEMQVSKYREKEKSLLKIVESLSAQQVNRWKEKSDEEQPHSQSEEDDYSP